MNDGMTVWSVGAPEGEYLPVFCGPRSSPDTRTVLAPSWAGRTLVDLHNAEVEAARRHRPTVGDIEAMLVRVLAAALRELVRDLRPRWLRRPRRTRRTPSRS